MGWAWLSWLQREPCSPFFQLFVHQTSEILLCKETLQQVNPQCICCMRLVQGSAPLLNFKRSQSICSFNLLCLWIPILTSSLSIIPIPNFMSPVNVLRVYSISFSRWLMKTVNVSNSKPWGMSCLTSDYLNPYSLNTWVQTVFHWPGILPVQSCFSPSDTKRLCHVFSSLHTHTLNHTIV